MHDNEATRDAMLDHDPPTPHASRIDIQRFLFWALFLTAIAAFILATVLAS